MSDQTNGLRFDVYERVHLPDDVAAIDELEEIELVPRIQVIDQGDHALLKGQLLLSGVYRGQNTSDHPLALEHWIPVEISLPMNRITRLDDISIEIDNFDVDLLSARTLNITGVLSLRGISVEPLLEQEEEAWNEEPFTAVHERELYDEQAVQQDESEAPAPWMASASSFDEPIHDQEREEEEAQDTALVSQQAEADSWNAESTEWISAAQTEADSQAFYQAEDSSRVDEPERQSEQQSEPQVQYDIEPLPEQRPQLADEIKQELETESAPEEQETQLVSEQKKQEVQIAFSAKQPSISEDQPSDVGLLTVLQSSKREQAAREAAEQIIEEQKAAEKIAREQEIEEDIEWKSLFLSKQTDANEFRKIRVCIVQREETLEQIALRYSMNPRDLIAHNGLHESSVEEGQLLYIP